MNFSNLYNIISSLANSTESQTALKMRPTFVKSVAALIAFLGGTSALGINCAGSGFCALAGWDSPSPQSIVQILRDVVWESAMPNSTSYNSGSHITCVSVSQKISIGASLLWLNGNIGEGGVCLFPQGSSLTLEKIRPLTNAILEHGCKVCGSVPIHYVDEGSNDPTDGILTFNYVANPYCDGDCISNAPGPVIIITYYNTITLTSTVQTTVTSSVTSTSTQYSTNTITSTSTITIYEQQVSISN
jgi:hypothetical protein